MTTKNAPKTDKPNTFLLNTEMKQYALYQTMMTITSAAGHLKDETEKGRQITICDAVRYAFSQSPIDNDYNRRFFYEVCRLMLVMPESKVIAPKTKPSQSPLKKAALLGWQVVK